MYMYIRVIVTDISAYVYSYMFAYLYVPIDVRICAYVCSYNQFVYVYVLESYMFI